MKNKNKKIPSYRKYYLKSKPFRFFDIILLLILLIIFITLIVRYFPIKKGEYAIVYQNGNVIDKLDLNINREYTYNIEGHINVVVKDKKVFVISNDCPNKICVHSPPISKEGEIIVCAPKKFVLKIVSKKGFFVTG